MSQADRNYLQYSDSCSGVSPDDEFEGLWIEYWPNGKMKFRGEYKKRCRRIGQHISFYDNGVLQELSCWDEGWVCGTVVWFREDGSKECEKDFGEHGGRTRAWVQRAYGLNSDLYAVYVYERDQLIAEWVRMDVREMGEQIDIDGIVDDAVKRFFPEDR